MKELIRVYKALSDASRLRVLNLVLERECCVCEVMQALEISQSRASRSLGALHDVGILKLRREGLWALYTVDWDGMDEALREIVSVTGRSIVANKQMEADRERLKKAERVGPKCVNRMGRDARIQL